MNSISIRTRGPYDLNRSHRYVNFSSQFADGELVHTPSQPVSPSLAEEYSISNNAVLRSGSSKLKQRLNVDAVDLEPLIKKLQ